jgi:C-terminal processing protease CtpA/Prc
MPGDEVRILSPEGGGGYVTGFVEEVRSTRGGTFVDVVEAATGNHIAGVPLRQLQRRNKPSNSSEDIGQLQRRASTGSAADDKSNDISTSRVAKRSQSGKRGSLGAMPMSKASVPVPGNKPSARLKLRRSINGREELVKAVFSEEEFGFAFDDNIEEGDMEVINHGVEVTQVTQGSAAMLLGVKVGDVIHAIGTRLVSRSAGKDTIRLLLNAQTRRPAVITFARWVNPIDNWQEHCEVSDMSDLKAVDVHLFSRDLGLKVVNGKFQMAPGGFESDEIIVASVKKNSAAYNQGIEKGHAILGINGMRWRNPPKAKTFSKTLDDAVRPIVIHTHRGVAGTAFTSIAPQPPAPSHAFNSPASDGGMNFGVDIDSDEVDLPAIRESSIDPVHELGSETPPRDRGSQSSQLMTEDGGRLLTASLCSKAKLGLSITDDEYGVVVAAVSSGSEAEVLGIRAGDYLVQVNNTVLPPDVSHANVSKLIKMSTRPLKLVLERYGDEDEFVGGSIDLVKVPDEIGDQEELMIPSYDPIGIKCTNGKNGRLFVTSVEQGSFGEDLGIEVGDEVVSVNGVLWAETSGDDRPAPLTRRSSSFFSSSSASASPKGSKKRASVTEVRKHVNRDAHLLFADVVAHSTRPLLLTVRRGSAENLVTPKLNRGSLFRSASMPQQW